MLPLNSGHGYVWPRPDGRQAACGGPALCSICRADQAKVLVIQVIAPGTVPQEYVIFKDDPRVSDVIRHLRANTIHHRGG